MKNKITVDEQIDHMKSKNIKFQIMNEDEAKDFLSTRTYYFKLKSYAKSFQTMNTCSNYLKLDFAYLVELSTLDAHLRQFIMNLSLSIEHSLKTKLIRDFTNNPNEDGYSIISDFVIQYPFILQNINIKRNDSACADLICKYHPNWPIWAIVEVLSFGDFIKLFRFYYTKYPDSESKKVMDLLWSAKFIRNAAAHNNCIINDITVKNAKHQTNHSVMRSLNKISPQRNRKQLSKEKMRQLVTLLYTSQHIITSDGVKAKIRNQLSFLKTRIYRDYDYSFNQTLKATFDYLIEIFDNFY